LTPFLIKRDGKQDGFPSKPDLKDRACFFGRLLSFKAFSFLYLKPAAFWMIGWSNGKVITVGNLSRVRQSVDAQTATSPSGTRDAAVVDNFVWCLHF
jgi:hypothetical protein